MVGTIAGDGKSHRIDLQVLTPPASTGDSETITVEKCESEPVQGVITAIDLGPCDDEGNTPIRLTCEVDHDGPVTVQWFVDGQPFGGPSSPGPQVGSIPGDGAEHVAELRVLSPDNASGDTETFEVPACEEEVVATITAVDWIPEDEEPTEPENPDEQLPASITAVEFVPEDEPIEDAPQAEGKISAIEFVEDEEEDQ